MLGADVDVATTGLCTICKQLCGNMPGSLMLILEEMQNLHHVNLTILGVP